MTVKELREKYNLTQAALAKTLDVSSNAISGIESGRIKLSSKMAARIKEKYGEEVEQAVITTAGKGVKKVEKAGEKPAEDAAAGAAAGTAAEAAGEAVLPAEAAAEAAAPVEKKAGKPVKKKGPAKKTAEKKSAAKKAAVKPAAVPTVILQSPFGGEITIEEILTKTGKVDRVYVRIDQNKLYWVQGNETGDQDIW